MFVETVVEEVYTFKVCNMFQNVKSPLPHVPDSHPCILPTAYNSISVVQPCYHTHTHTNEEQAQAHTNTHFLLHRAFIAGIFTYSPGKRIKSQNIMWPQRVPIPAHHWQIFDWLLKCWHLHIDSQTREDQKVKCLRRTNISVWNFCS